ncbi:GSCOCG00003147001-RA-CDS [Cotesia congregata]|nr:GSCOCG00003147001-RA-CDS [Cotesia congregata]
MTNKACWKFDEQERALYIDVEVDEEDKENPKVYSAWDKLPDILLEEIFSYLTVRQRYYASLVCRSWYQAFKLPRVWSTFTVQDTTLTRGKFNYYSGWCYVLDHIRTSSCFYRVGRNFRSLVFEPSYNFYNLYEFMNMFTWFCLRKPGDDPYIPGMGHNIRHLKFIFPCNMANRDDPEQIKIFGTGGKLLETVKKLTSNLKNLRSVEFIDLMLDSKEALYFLDNICDNCTETLKKLVLINTTKLYCPLLHVGVFLNLNILVISPQNLDNDVLDLIGYTKLRHMHIFQNRYSPVDSTVRLPKQLAWIKLGKNNPYLKVHFEVESNKPEIILPIEFPEHNSIPCYSIVIDNQTAQPTAAMMLAQAINFQKTLSIYAIKSIPKYYQHRSFSKRVDEIIVRVCRTCPNIHTLMIRDKISTSTLLEIASTAKSLRYLYVRRQAVLKRCDKTWSVVTEWTPEHQEWIKSICKSYEDTEKEISKILGYRWRMLTEKEFKQQTIHLYV